MFLFSTLCAWLVTIVPISYRFWDKKKRLHNFPTSWNSVTTMGLELARMMPLYQSVNKMWHFANKYMDGWMDGYVYSIWLVLRTSTRLPGYPFEYPLPRYPLHTRVPLNTRLYFLKSWNQQRFKFGSHVSCSLRLFKVAYIHVRCLLTPAWDCL